MALVGLPMTWPWLTRSSVLLGNRRPLGLLRVWQARPLPVVLSTMQRRPGLGSERVFLPLALLIPLALVLVILAQVPGVGLAAPTALVPASDAAASMIRRPQPSNA